MKISELRQLTPKKMQEQLKTLRRSLAVFKFHIQTGKENNTAKVGQLKKGIARVLTLMKQQ
jgi:large subunit ribosomal protein L29